MIVSSLRKLIITTIANNQNHGVSKVFQVQENIVEEKPLTDEIWAHKFSQQNVIITTIAFGNIISIQ